MPKRFPRPSRGPRSPAGSWPLRELDGWRGGRALLLGILTGNRPVIAEVYDTLAIKFPIL